MGYRELRAPRVSVLFQKRGEVKKIKLCQVYTRTQSCLSTCDWCIDTTNGDHAGGCAKAASEPASAVQFSVSPRRKRISKKIQDAGMSEMSKM